MITITFHVIMALGIMGLTYVTVIHKLLISKQMSDKYYKNFALGILAFAVYVNCGGVFYAGIDCSWMLNNLRAGEMELQKLLDLANNLIVNMEYMTGYLFACIACYVLTLLLLKSIQKDIQKDFDKPKYRWGSIN